MGFTIDLKNDFVHEADTECTLACKYEKLHAILVKVRLAITEAVRTWS